MNRPELEQLNTDLGRLTMLLHRVQSVLNDMHYRVRAELYPAENLDDIDRGHGEPRCEHLIPIGDFCPKCAPHHCIVHDTDTVGRCPYCVETHRIDTPEG
jgi:hypothetical protein